MIQNLSGGFFRFGGSNIQSLAIRTKSFQHFPDTGVGHILKFADWNIATAENTDGFIQTILRNTKMTEGIPKGRTDKNSHFFPGRDRNPQFFHSVGSAVHDSLAGICKRTVQIKKYSLG